MFFLFDWHGPSSQDVQLHFLTKISILYSECWIVFQPTKNVKCPFQCFLYGHLASPIGYKSDFYYLIKELLLALQKFHSILQTFYIRKEKYTCEECRMRFLEC